jgi:hypothetical protein
MPTLTTAARDAAVNAVVDLIDVGTTDPTGDIQFQTAADAPVATLPFANPAFGASASGSASANAITSDTNAAGGTTNKALLRNRNNVEVLRVTVATSGAEINLSSVAIGAGDTVSLSSLSVSQPAS